jgi:hypothetical protein
MKGLRASTIFRSAIGSMRNQKFRNFTPKCPGGHVERRVARIEIVSEIRKDGSHSSHRFRIWQRIRFSHGGRYYATTNNASRIVAKGLASGLLLRFSPVEEPRAVVCIQPREDAS